MGGGGGGNCSGDHINKQMIVKHPSSPPGELLATFCSTPLSVAKKGGTCPKQIF